ncbi:MAG: M24 family metallopeptidase [Steroidobacteraceae bacterium]|nr:M24 family metallopeptidase [Steroidobacteraceae bacterium]
MTASRIVAAAAAVAAALALPLAGAVAADRPDQGRAIGGADAYAVLPPRARIEPENRMLQERLETLLPRLMAEAGLDMWLVINREYAEDPVYFTLVPQPSFAARRTTMLVFNRRPDGTFERLSVNRYPLGKPYSTGWEGGSLDAQWQALGELIRERNPARIGVNASRHWPVADGLTHALRERLLEVLPPGFEKRFVPAETLVIRWLETRTPSELAIYPHVVALSRGVIAEGFSSRVITPGVTTTDDVAWYLRERFESLGLPIWFMPYVNRQAPGLECGPKTDFCGMSGVIQPGDVLHTDVGVCYLKLCTDVQEMAYVARVGESDAPAGLQAALAVGNRWQDLLTAEFRAGRTGNEVLARAQAASQRAGIASTIYTHPLGFFGHAPGPTIGMWDDQGPTPVQGDWPLHPSTVYAIEGNVKVPVAEWGGQLVQVKLEQDALFDGEKVTYLAGRQTRWHVVR